MRPGRLLLEAAPVNFLAHAYLADPDPESIVGNLMADLVKGRIEPTLPSRVQEGIRLHRKVDAFADSHGVFLQSLRRIRPRWRRYSGILIDMFYDHFLAADWGRYSDRSLRTFADDVYGALQIQKDGCPEHMQTAIARMIHYDWLVSYADLQKVEISLARLSKRSRNPHLHLENAMTDLQTHYRDLAADFHLFFPALITYVEGEKRLPEPQAV